MIKREFLYLGLYLILCVPAIVIYVKFSMKAKREWLMLAGRLKPASVPENEKREFIRLDSAFPVEFQKIKGPDDDGEADVHQGFTANVSKTGMSIEALMVHGRPLADILPGRTRLKLFINIPDETRTIIAPSTVKWVNKAEEGAVDRYSIGVSYDDLQEPDLERIMNYALWFRRKPDILAVLVVLVFVLAAIFIATTLIFEKKNSSLEENIAAFDRKNRILENEIAALKKEKEAASDEISLAARNYAALHDRAKDMEKEYREKMVTAAQETQPVLLPATTEIPVPPEKEAEELSPVAVEEEVEAGEEEEISEPVVEMRAAAGTASGGDEIVVEPNITRKMINDEKDILKTFRDYILKDEIQLLDRYCSLHKGSIYHAAGLFAMGELRYKRGHIKEMIMKAYSDVIKLYPDSKYASYASHRLEQLARNLPYESRSLKYFHTEYNLPPFFDYRELEPYKE